MRYRKLSTDRDYVFGQQAEFFVDNAACVGQAILTRLLLNQGEWFLDTAEGTPYDTEVLGYNTQGTRDAAIRDRIVGTPNVTQITQYSSSYNGETRAFTVQATVDTAFGPTTITAVL